MKRRPQLGVTWWFYPIAAIVILALFCVCYFLAINATWNAGRETEFHGAAE